MLASNVGSSSTNTIRAKAREHFIEERGFIRLQQKPHSG